MYLQNSVKKQRREYERYKNGLLYKRRQIFIFEDRISGSSIITLLPMILEVAILNVKPGRSDQFETDFHTAGQYISSIKGYIKHTLKKCVEIRNQYILLVEWASVEAHEIGFRQSPQYLKWKELLHDYYDPFPQVLHYESVIDNS
ncbi:antibiotic biosynthesis monooxygenase family protein [Sphingobacterium spiritivorum]|uniref:antibiotic biosynthesis monooxygenase family protein n=2 Tax=Sphingobacterium spiritivorum TaxID=258 RepID=UPI003DA2654D